MSNIDRIDPRILSIGANLIGMAMEASLREQQPEDDVLGAATKAYQAAPSGQIVVEATTGCEAPRKITKSQYLAVINALDETTTVQTTATSEPSWNREYLAANAYLNQFRK